jgi:hypothetical protein
MAITPTLKSVPTSPLNVICRCGATPRLAHKILDPRKGGTLRMYKCQCGQQMWVEHQE